MICAYNYYNMSVPTAYLESDLIKTFFTTAASAQICKAQNEVINKHTHTLSNAVYTLAPTAAAFNSLRWFVWCAPSSGAATFRGSPCLNHTPIPAIASGLPLCRHAPSTKTTSVSLDTSGIEAAAVVGWRGWCIFWKRRFVHSATEFCAVRKRTVVGWEDGGPSSVSPNTLGIGLGIGCDWKYGVQFS